MSALNFTCLNGFKSMTLLFNRYKILTVVKLLQAKRNKTQRDVQLYENNDTHCVLLYITHNALVKRV